MNSLGLYISSISPLTTYYPWVCWCAVGILVGIVAARSLGGRRMMWLDVIISILGAIAGGSMSFFAIGDNTMQTFIISVLVAVFGSGVILWAYDWLLLRLFRKEQEPTDRKK